MRTLIQVIKVSAFSGQHCMREDVVLCCFFFKKITSTLDFDTIVSAMPVLHIVRACVRVCVNSVGCGSD